MEPQLTPPLNNDIVISVPQEKPKANQFSVWRLFSALFLIAAVIFCGVGLKEMYSYGYDDKIVGGDAYNYIIIAARGTGLICAGVLSSVIGLTMGVYELAAKKG